MKTDTAFIFLKCGLFWEENVPFERRGGNAGHPSYGAVLQKDMKYFEYRAPGSKLSGRENAAGSIPGTPVPAGVPLHRWPGSTLFAPVIRISGDTDLPVEAG